MAIDFPASPSLNDTFSSGGVTYTWDGTVWAASGSAAFVQKSGDTMSGALAIDADLTVDTDTLYVDSTNNRVGIGKSNPNKILHISGTDPIIQITDTDAVINSQIGNVGEDLYISNDFVGAGAGSTIQFWNGGTEKMRIDSNGQLGIGTSSPDANLKIQPSDSDTPANAFAVRQNNAADTAQTTFSVEASPTDGVSRLISSATSTPQLAFYTGGSERMRIDSSGSIIFGTATPAQIVAGTANGKYYQGTDTNFISSRATSSSAAHQSFSNSNGVVGSIATSGSSTSYNTSSDYRLKENVVSISDGITRLKELAPKRFNFIADADTIVDGFIAHEAQAVVPEAVTGTHNEVDDDGNPIYQGIDQSKLVPLLTAALKEAIAKIEVLEQRLEDAGL